MRPASCLNIGKAGREFKENRDRSRANFPEIPAQRSQPAGMFQAGRLDST